MTSLAPMNGADVRYPTMSHGPAHMAHLSVLVPLIVLASCLLFAACDVFEDEPQFDEVPPERLVAFTAVYAETDSGGAPLERVILADYENPSVYKVISDPEGISRSGRLSPSKRQIIFGDRKNGSVHDPHLIQYENAGDTTTSLYLRFLDGVRLSLVAPLANVVWSPDEAGFFATNPLQSVGGGRELLYYTFAEETWKEVRERGLSITLYPVDLKGQDTLIVFSDEFARTGSGPMGHYFMNFEGEYLGYIDNPHLEGINRDGIMMKGAFSLSWNDAQGRLAIAYHDSTFEGYKIAATDLTGSYYREYTSGAFIDDHPRWGPEGKTILFDRRELFDTSFTGYRLMVLDVETGAVREFAKPKTYGAVALWLPDY